MGVELNEVVHIIVRSILVLAAYYVKPAACTKLLRARTTTSLRRIKPVIIHIPPVIDFFCELNFIT